MVIVGAGVATVVATTILQARRPKRPASTRPPSDKQVVSHLTVKCRDLEDSVKFYLVLGFLEVSRTKDAVLLSLPEQGIGYAPYLLLQKIPPSDDGAASSTISEQQQEHCTVAGYGRIALLVPSIIRSSNHMQSTLGLEPIAKPVTDMTTDKNGKPLSTISIAAWRDPDGTVVELVESHDRSLRGFLYLLYCLGIFHYPVWVHCNINVSNYSESMKAYRQLGFEVVSDHGRVKNKLYKALGIPDPGVAKQVSMLKRRGDSFQMDIIEWEDPKTLQSKSKKLAGFVSLSLTAMSGEVGRLPVGFEAEDSVEELELPVPLGRTRRRKLLDPDGSTVELVEFR